LRIKGGTTTGQGFRSIKKVASIEDSALVKKAEKVLKKNIKNKNGYKVFKIEKGRMRDKVKPGGLIDQLMDIGLKDQHKITKLIDEIAEKNNWLTRDVYRRNVIVDSYMKDYGEFDEFTGRGKYDSRLVEFKIKTPQNEYKWINNTFEEWKDGKFEVEGYDRKKFDKILTKNLKNWKPINVSKKMIASQEELKWLDQMNTKHPNWSMEKVEKAFNKNFKNSEFFMDTSFNNRALDLYPYKMVGNNKGYVVKGVGEGERSKWLKQIVRDTKGGNYTKFLIAADMYEGRGNLKVAQKLKKGAELFFGKTGIFTEMGDQAEHPWFRNYGGWQGQFQIDSLVKGDLNAWKANNFEFPVRDLIKKYEAKGISDLQKSRIKSQINLRRKFINHFTDIGDGGMARNITFDFESKPGKVKVINKTPDISKLHHTGKLDPLDMQSRGDEYRKALIKNLGAKDINILTKDKTISAKRISADKIQKILGQREIKVTSKEAGFIATDMLKDFGKMGVKGLKLLNWLQLEYDVAFESLIYQYHKQYEGHEPGLAREALFLPKILAKYFPDLKKLPFVGDLFEPYEAGIMEGPAEVLEKRLSEIKGTEKENLGKVIGEKKLVKNYIDNNKRMEEISSKYRSLDFAKGLKSDRRPGQSYYAEPFAHPRLDTIVNEQRRLENEYNQLDQLNKPDSLSGYHSAYQTALEAQDTEYGVKATEAHKKRLGVDEERLDELNELFFTERDKMKYPRTFGQEKREVSNLERAQKRFEREQVDKRRKAVEDKFPSYSKAQIDKILKISGYVIDPNIAKYKKDLKFLTKEDIPNKYKPAFPPRVEAKPLSTYDTIRGILSDEDKLRYYADNFRMEKAQGGIMSLKKKW